MKTNRHVNSIPASPIRVSRKWSAINRAESAAIKTSCNLHEILTGVSSTDASIVVFGSLARKEMELQKRRRLDLVG